VQQQDTSASASTHRLYQTWDVWEAEYPPGQITLGGNVAAGALPLPGTSLGMYVVIIEALE